jgi:RimJ/RimL family protein N-acetyltransferase
MSSANIPPIPFREPYEKPSYVFGDRYGEYGAVRIYNGDKIPNQSIIDKLEGNNFVLMPDTNNIFYKKKANGDAIFLQICHGSYTATEHAQAQAIRAKNLSHLDFLYRQAHKDNQDAILQQMQQILYTTPTLEDLQRIQEAAAAAADDDADAAANIIGIYEIIIPATASAAALQTFAFTNSSNNYTSLYLNLKLKQKQKTNHTKYYPIPKSKSKLQLPTTKTTTKTTTETTTETAQKIEEPPRRVRQPPPKKSSMMTADVIELKKLSLITKAQEQQLASIAANPTVMEYVANGKPWDAAKVAKLVSQSKSDWSEIKAGSTTPWMHWAIMKGDDDGTLIGYLAIYPEKGEEDEDLYFLRYFVRQDLQREGYGSQALRLAIEEFRELRPEASFLYASVHDKNKGGQIFLEKNLFTKFGEARQIGKITVVDFFKSLS